MKSVLSGVCCENLGLIIRLMVSWWQFRFAFFQFSCFNDLKLDNTITMAPRMVSVDLMSYKLSEKVTYLTFNKGNKVFLFWIGIPSQKSETMNHLKIKRQPWFPWKPKLCQETHFWTSFQKTLPEWILRRVTGFFAGGGGGCAPSVFGSQICRRLVGIGV